MFGLFGPRGFDGLSDEVRAILKSLLGSDGVAALEALSRRHGIFDAKLVRNLNGHPKKESFLSLVFALRLPGIANDLAGRGHLEDAEALYLLALKSSPGLAQALAPLAHLCVERGDLAGALDYARQALKSLRESYDSSSPETLKLKVQMGRVLVEDFLRRKLGPDSLERARSLFGTRLLTQEATETLAVLALNVADTESDEALEDYGKFFADLLFDVANKHCIEMGEKMGRADNPLAAMKALAEHGPQALELLWYATVLFPEHLDAWILAARQQDLANSLGYPAPVPQKAASTALSLLDSMERGDPAVYTKDPRIQGDGRATARQFLADRATRE